MAFNPVIDEHLARTIRHGIGRNTAGKEQAVLADAAGIGGKQDNGLQVTEVERPRLPRRPNLSSLKPPARKQEGCEESEGAGERQSDTERG